MKTSENKNVVIFKGAGYLLGLTVTLASALTVFAISKNLVVSVSASAPIGITLGIVFEQRLHGIKVIFSPRTGKIIMGLLSIGILLFFAIFIVTKVI